MLARLAMSLGLTMSTPSPAPPPPPRPSMIVVVGASGTPEYGTEFRRAASRWEAAAKKGSAEFLPIGVTSAGATPDRDRLREALAGQTSEGTEPLWLVLIGHGTFDGREAKFNLRGPDVSDAELAGWLKPIRRPLAVVVGSSSSGPFLNHLSGAGRVVVTATRSGDEQNFARFGGYLAETIADPRADLDKDRQVSLLEAFVSASHRADEFYKTRSRLATEHALIDDNGDRLGTPAEWFRGVRASRRARDGAEPDGVRAHQLHLILGEGERRIPPEVRARRDELERSVASLRSKKDQIDEADYYAKLEPILVELARLYRDAGRGTQEPAK